MKKSIITLAVAAGLAAAGAANAAPKVYGNLHVSINDFDSAANLDMSSNTSAIGVKGSEDLGDGMKAIYKVEFQIDPTERCSSPKASASTLQFTDTNGNGVYDAGEAITGYTTGSSSGCSAITDRDQFVGLKGGMGTVKFGTMSSNYKQMGGKVDPMYRTRLEGRGFLGTQSSALHGGAGTNRGRMTNQIQFVSPKMGGIQAVFNTTVSGSEEESMGLGIRYKTKKLLAYFDWIDTQTGAATTGAAVTEAAMKVGAKFKGKGFSVSGQFESAEDRTGNDYIFLAGTFNVDKNNIIAVSFGQAKALAANSDSDGLAIMYNHKLSKKTNVYAGYGKKSADVAANEDDVLTLGIKKKF